MLYDVMYKTYRELYGVKELPTFLKFRLNNIGARNLNYNSFCEYFDLTDRFETLKFILADANLEMIERYTNAHKDSVYYAGNRRVGHK